MKKIELHDMVARLMEKFDDNVMRTILDFSPPTEEVERVSWLAARFRDRTLSREEEFEFQGCLGFATCLGAMQSNAHRRIKNMPELVREMS